MQGKLKNFILALSFMLGLVLFTSPVFAQAAPAGAAAAAPAPSATKIGIININDAILSSNEGKKESEELQKRFSGKQVELKTLNDEVEGLKKQLQTTGDKLSDEERATRAKSLETKTKSLQRNFEDAQNEFQQAEQEIVNKIGSKMYGEIEKYAKANGYTVVLNVDPQSSTVLWANQGTIITQQVVEAYNTDFPVSGATNAAAKPAGTTPARPATTAPRPAVPAAPTPKKPS